MEKEFYEIATIDATKEDFEANGFKVISFGAVKKHLKQILKNENLVTKFSRWNNIIEPNNIEMINIENELKKVVFKESRGGGGYYSISWENLETYLRYHPNAMYNLFKD